MYLNLLNGFDNLLQGIEDNITQTWNAVISIKDKIDNTLNWLKETFDSTSDKYWFKVAFMTDAEYQIDYAKRWIDLFKTKFSFFYAVKDSLTRIADTFVSSPSRPNFDINLPANYGGKISVINFDVIDPHVHTLKNWIALSLWIVFLFKMIKLAPTLIDE